MSEVVGTHSRIPKRICSSRPVFKSLIQYMQMLIELCLFTISVRSGDWELHLKVMDAMTKYFFARDKLNYARVILLYSRDGRATYKIT